MIKMQEKEFDAMRFSDVPGHKQEFVKLYYLGSHSDYVKPW